MPQQGIPSSQQGTPLSQRFSYVEGTVRLACLFFTLLWLEACFNCSLTHGRPHMYIGIPTRERMSTIAGDPG